MIDRPLYLNKLMSWKDKDTIKVITGIRRCGKSKMLECFASKLKAQGVTSKQIIKINFEEMGDGQITDAQTLHDKIDGILKKNKDKMTYIMLDEVQKIPEWEKAVASLRLRKNADLYLTGSNAYMLSSELATFLSGRYVEIKMLPLSFKEFLSFHSFPSDMSLERKFALYTKFGGMPALKDFNFNEGQSYEILDGIYNTVLVKDVTSRVKTTNITAIEKIIHFLADNISNITSTNSITNTLYSARSIESKNNAYVEGYINLLEKSFIFYPIQRYDIKGKEFLQSLEKYYIVDTGLRYRILGRLSDTGRILENIVYFELLRRGYNVSVGKIGDMEIDFIATRGEEKIYIQVSNEINDAKTRERELGALQAVRDNFEKIILTMNYLHIGTTEDGIKVIHLIDWLLEN
ncbi:MAG: ATP-binding protein [Alphaproteobacteria bacterium]|nr:ATP-binding protein [Alphaproteobacteria bacterium]